MRRLLAVMMLLALAGAARGETARQILDRQRALEDGERRWSDRYEAMRMEVLDANRQPRHMTVELFDKKYPGRQQRTMAYFTAPDSVKGTAFLAVTHPDRQDEQWLYLPEYKRARRIGGAVRTQGFVGTDFTYHDLDLLAEMPSWSEANAVSHLRGDASVDGTACHIIELTPQREDIGYRHIVLWLGRDDLIARQVEFYDEAPAAGWFGGGGDDGAAPTRRMRQSDVRPVGKIPVPHRIDVETPRAGTKTVVILTAIAFDQALPDELFSQPAMEWGSYRPPAATSASR